MAHKRGKRMPSYLKYSCVKLCILRFFEYSRSLVVGPLVGWLVRDVCEKVTFIVSNGNINLPNYVTLVTVVTLGRTETLCPNESCLCFESCYFRVLLQSWELCLVLGIVRYLVLNSNYSDRSHDSQN